MYKSAGITVGELLNIELLKESKILSGGNGLNRMITNVNVMEVPDILDWITPGEFLLTTAYSIKDNVKSLNKLIPELKAKGLAGLGIKTKRYLKEIPENILATAEHLDFPVIEIPYEVTYAQIIKVVLTEIINKQANILLKIDNFHNRLMAIMLKGGSLNEIAKAIHNTIHNSVAIREDIFKTNMIICEADTRPYIEEILKNESDQDKNFKDNKTSPFRTKDIIKEKETVRIMIPICTEERNFGFIYIWEDNKIVTPVELTVIESSTSVIALDLVKKLSIFEIENNHKIEFFDELFSSDEGRHKKAMERSTFFNFNRNLSYAVLVISIHNIEKLFALTPNNNSYLHRLNGKLISIIERLSRFRGEKIIYGNKSDRIIVLFGSEKGQSPQVLKENIIDFGQSILGYAKRESIKENIAIGIGRNYENINELYKSYRESTRATENSNIQRDNIPIHYDDLGIYKILSYEELKPELYQFYRAILEPLVRYDKEKDSELIKTIKKYFECRGNLKRVSEEMYTHYNTIIYRIQRIKDIAGINFEDHNDMLNLQIAIRILDILEKDEISQ